jgi:hypothetical protein
VGILRVVGTLAVEQFWPDGESDADTTNLLIKLAPTNPFAYAADDKTFRPTKAFQGTKVRGQYGTKPPISAKGILRIRLQGVDAPELHYQPSVLSKASGVSAATRKKYNALRARFRQHLAESSTVALWAYLSNNGQRRILNCVGYTKVERPTDVFDVYGRFVGDLNVKVGQKSVNVNRWLLNEGWVVPGFYASMTIDEIDTALSAYAKGEKIKGRVPKKFSTDTTKFESKLIERKGSDVIAAGGFKMLEDTGQVLNPKLFRRQVTWWAQKKAKVTKDGFGAYLDGRKDSFHLIDEFRNSLDEAKFYRFTDFLKSGKINLQPDQPIYKEDASKLVDDKGRLVTRW